MNEFLRKRAPVLLGLLVVAVIITILIILLKTQSLKPEKHNSGSAALIMGATQP
jgi:competence protein ComGC